MAAAFVVRGVLHEELFFETSNEMLVVWEKMKAFIEDLRRVRSNPTLYGNLEKGARKQIEWLNQQAPGAYAAIQALASPRK